MIGFDEALNTVLAHARPLGKTKVRLENLLGGYLAEPVIANRDLPGFDNSAVDGFGVLLSDVRLASPESPVRLEIADTIQAGDGRKFALKSGQTFKILTGAPVPSSVDAVMMREDCEERDGTIWVREVPVPGENIRRRGEEFKKGAEILPAGTRVNPAVIGLLATLGHTAHWTYRKPKVALVVTGSELVSPGKPLGPGKIYESNSHALAAAVRELGISDCKTYRVRDDARETRQTLARALREADVVIPVGGVSVGEYDLVKDSLTELGVEKIFWKIAMKPGKPVYFGTYQSNSRGNDDTARRKLVFGLPGNPVSALVTFNLLVKPVLLKLMGSPDPAPVKLKAELAGKLRKKPGRMEFVRGVAKAENGLLRVQPTVGQDSHMLGGLSKANCLIHFPTELDSLAENEPVCVELLELR